MEYWKMIRNKVGNETVIMLAAGAIIQNNEGKILLQKKEKIQICGDYLEV